MTKKVNPPVSYVGGKSHMRELLISLFPNHDTYVEVFGGSGNIILMKDPTTCNVYNDIRGDIVTFFKVVQDKTKVYKLLSILHLTPYSRQYFHEIRDGKYRPPNIDDDIFTAYKVIFMMNQAFSAKFLNDTPVWAFSITTDVRIKRWIKVPSKLSKFIDILQRIQIENKDFKYIIQTYDTPNTLFYCDPPYYNLEKYYTDDFSVQDHNDLSNLLNNIKGKAIVSYYYFEGIEELYPKPKWNYMDIDQPIYSQKIYNNKGETRQHKREYIIMNYKITNRTLF